MFVNSSMTVMLARMVILVMTVSTIAQTFQNTFVLLYFDIISYSDRLNNMDFWIRVCSHYHLKSFTFLTVASGCFVMFCNVIMYAICVYCKCVCIRIY